MAFKLPQPVNKDEFDKLLQKSKEKLDSYWQPRKEEYKPRGKQIQQYIIAMILAYGAGMRISEIVGLKKTYQYKYKPKDKPEELRTQICDIPALTPERIENNFIRVIGAKGGKDRQVPLPVKLFKKVSISRKEFISELPLKMKRSAIQRYVTLLGKEVLGKDISIHKLRHGFATYMVESNIDLHELQRLMGHSRLDTTGIYLHANPKKTMEKYEQIEW